MNKDILEQSERLDAASDTIVSTALKATGEDSGDALRALCVAVAKLAATVSVPLPGRFEHILLVCAATTTGTALGMRDGFRQDCPTEPMVLDKFAPDTEGVPELLRALMETCASHTTDDQEGHRKAVYATASLVGLLTAQLSESLKRDNAASVLLEALDTAMSAAAFACKTEGLTPSPPIRSSARTIVAPLEPGSLH